MSPAMSYFTENPSAIFVVNFIALLMLAAVLLIYKKEAEANIVAEYAYFVLVTGVLIQLVQYIREKPKAEAQ